ncbi:MAG TPA: S8 family serine peptidase [Pyrinomonadaceae bacterium]
MSLGMAAVDSFRNDPACKAVRRMADAGVVVVVAAGNNGKDEAGQKVYGQVHSPGNEPSAITVGASNTYGTDIRSDDTVATYSSRGPTRSYWTDVSGTRYYDHLIKPDLVAPGNKLISAQATGNKLITEYPQMDPGVNVGFSTNSRLMYMSGTSVSAPVVAGTAALMLRMQPKLTPNLVKMI